MNGKRARKLRKMAAIMASPNAPIRDLQEVNHHPKLYPWLVKTKMLQDGTQEVLDNGMRLTHQVINNPQSQRGIYLQLKRLGY